MLDQASAVSLCTGARNQKNTPAPGKDQVAPTKNPVRETNTAVAGATAQSGTSSAWNTASRRPRPESVIGQHGDHIDHRHEAERVGERPVHALRARGEIVEPDVTGVADAGEEQHGEGLPAAGEEKIEDARELRNALAERKPARMPERPPRTVDEIPSHHREPRCTEEKEHRVEERGGRGRVLKPLGTQRGDHGGPDHHDKKTGEPLHEHGEHGGDLPLRVPEHDGRDLRRVAACRAGKKERDEQAEKMQPRRVGETEWYAGDAQAQPPAQRAG